MNAESTLIKTIAVNGVELVNRDAVERAYSGKANTCCCGCAGKYYESSGDDKHRAMVTKIVNKINATILSGAQPMTDDEYVSVDVGGRMYTAYFPG